MADLELGNLLWNESNINQYYDCPRWVVSLLADIEREIDRVYWNENQKQWNSAFSNTGSEYIGTCFEVHAYNWDENKVQPYNFICGGIKISWYKHLRRNPTININPAGPQFTTRIISMYEKVIDELQREEP